MSAVSPFQLDYQKEDPRDVDRKFANELLGLSVDERNVIQDEIHGVGCLAPEETPELLEDSLKKLENALQTDNIIPYHLKFHYRKAQRLPKSYVNDRDFRLRFLRAMLFDPVKAAEKIARFLNVVVRFFGDVALQRPICLADFSSKEKQFIRKGHVQLLPFRDRSGRRILAGLNITMYTGKSNRPFMNMTPKEKSESAVYLQAKLLLYMVWAAGDDVENQRRGLVYLTWFDPTFKQNNDFNFNVLLYPRIQLQDLCTVRASSVHFCSQDTPLYRFYQKLNMIQIDKETRAKTRFHLGMSTELKYALGSYGIPVDDIPISSTGTIKLGIVKQWMRVRETIESIGHEGCTERKDTHPDTNMKLDSIVECPKLHDVLFRRGTSLHFHPGNAMVRRQIIEAHQERSDVYVRRRKLVLQIIKFTKDCGGQFLVWNEKGWWDVINDQASLVAKIEYVIKGVRKETRIETSDKIRNGTHVNLNSSTSMFYSHTAHANGTVNSHVGDNSLDFKEGGSDERHRGTNCFSPLGET